MICLASGPIPLAQLEPYEIEVEIEVANKAHQLAVQEDLVPVLGEVLAESGRQVGQVVVHTLPGSRSPQSASRRSSPPLPGHPEGCRRCLLGERRSRRIEPAGSRTGRIRRRRRRR